jgi:cytochrome c biogenesis protein CcmG, thiol:disulfide interchange protein DsbE
MKRLLPAFLAIVFALILFAGCGGAATSSARIGDKAPDFTLPGLEGGNVTLSSFSGKPVIINTWNVNCIECKKEMPFVQEVARQYAPQGLVVISVNTQDNRATTAEFLSKNGYSFTTVLDLKNDIYKKYNCPKTADPYTFFIGADGVIKSIKIGGFASKDELLTEVKKIIN